MIGERYYPDASDSIIDMVDAVELDLIEAGDAVGFVQHHRSRTHRYEVLS